MQNTCELPDDILRTLDELIVDRCGEHPESYMLTEAVTGYVAPGRCYRLQADGLSALPSEYAPGAALVEPPDTPPPHVRVSGVWNAVEDINPENANIFGGLGTLTLARADLVIPQAPTTAAALAFYGARLLAVGDALEFEAEQNLPVTVMNIGPAYVDDYLHIEGKGCGSFIEYHDQPHLHMPLEETAGGHILLGRAEGDEYLLSAFSIPYGHAVFTPPYALHADPYLVGRYLVVYAMPERYSTVVFRSRDGELIKTHIVKSL